MQADIKKSMTVVNYAGAAVVTLILASAAAFGVYPLYKHGAADIKAASELHTTLSQYDGLSKTLALTEEARKETEQRLMDAEKRLPSSLEASEFNAELTAVAQKAGIRIESMPNQNELKESGGYKALPVMIVGTGDWDSCYKFLTGIKGMNRLTRLDGVEMQVPDKDAKAQPSERPLCKITVRFSTFFMER